MFLHMDTIHLLGIVSNFANLYLVSTFLVHMPSVRASNQPYIRNQPGM